MVTSDSYDFGIQLAELRSDVRHIQSDVTDLKAGQRAINERLDKLSDRVDLRLDKLTNALWSAKVWALALYLALAGSLLYVLARGFKWL
jgi:hypothetical protein